MRVRHRETAMVLIVGSDGLLSHGFRRERQIDVIERYDGETPVGKSAVAILLGDFTEQERCREELLVTDMTAVLRLEEAVVLVSSVIAVT